VPESRDVGAAVGKLVQPSLVTPNRDAEGLDEPLAVAVVEPIGQINVFRGWPFPEPVDPFLRHQRIDKKGWVQAGDVVAVDFKVDVGVRDSPVKNSRQQFVHEVQSYARQDFVHTTRRVGKKRNGLASGPNVTPMITQRGIVNLAQLECNRVWVSNS